MAGNAGTLELELGSDIQPAGPIRTPDKVFDLDLVPRWVREQIIARQALRETQVDTRTEPPYQDMRDGLDADIY